MELKGQVIIVTGGASGIGKETARALARLGADLIIADYNEAGASSVATEIAGSGVRAHAFKVDAPRPSRWPRWAASTTTREGRRRDDGQVRRSRVGRACHGHHPE